MSDASCHTYGNCVLTETVTVKFLCYFKFGREERKALIVTCGFDLKCVGNILTDYVVYIYIYIYVCVCVCVCVCV